MSFLKELRELSPGSTQRELDFDGKNSLDLKASKLHDEFQKSKFNGMFYRKPGSWDEVISYYKSNRKHPIKMEDLFGILPPEDIQDLEFTERDVYGGSFNKPLKTFAPKFKARKLDAFFVITAEGVFAVRTEGADYARYVAQVEEYDGAEERVNEGLPSSYFAPTSLRKKPVPLYYSIKFYPPGAKSFKWVVIKAKDIKEARKIAERKYSVVQRVDKIVDPKKLGLKKYDLNVVKIGGPTGKPWNPTTE